MNKERKLELVCPGNTKLKVIFDKYGLPKVENFTFSFLHEKAFMKGTLRFTNKKMFTEGHLISELNDSKTMGSFFGACDRI